jgi:hypothetical protein
MYEGVTAALDVPDFVADTKSTASRGTLDFCCSLALNIIFCDAFNSSAYAHSGNTTGCATSSESADAYWSSSLTPANSSNLRKCPGSRKTDEPSKRWLKCCPLLLRCKNCANFFVALSGGDPGGEGGMSKLGTVGKVRFWVITRLAVYGEPGGASFRELSS